MDITLRTRHMLIIALGYTERLHEEIDKVYEERRWLYYESFKGSEYYKDMVIKSFISMREEKMRKVAGIVQWSVDNNDLSVINKLINKGFKGVARYYEQNKRSLDLWKFSQYMRKKNAKKWDDLNNFDLITNEIVLLYLASEDNANIDDILNSTYAKDCWQNIIKITNEVTHTYIIHKHIEENRKVQKQILKYIKETLKIDINKRYPTSVDNLFQSIITAETTKRAKKGGFKIGKVPLEEYDKVREQVMSTGIYRYIGAYSNLIKLSCLNMADLLNIEIPKELLMVYVFNAIKREENSSMHDEEIKQYLVSSLFMYAVTQHFKMQKEALLNDSNESWYLDVQKKEKELLEKENLLINSLKELQIQSQEHEKTVTKLNEDNEKLRKELERLRTENESFTEEKQELVELRNFAYSQKRATFNLESFDINKISNELNEMKLIICGGHPNLLHKLKEYIPNLDTLDTDTLNKSFSYLQNYDIVFFYPNYASHSFYKKIKSAIANSNTKLAYLPDVENLELILHNMHSNLNLVKT